ncbi:MAG: ABC transporter ATP-binding protein [Pseudomonadota bacterium]
MAILEAHGLVKHYKNVRAVEGVSFKVSEGICFGLLGPNGAGKSTTVEMMEGLVAPTAGEVFFRGAPRTDDYRQHIGIQFQHTALQDFLTVRENLKFFSALYKKTQPMEALISRCRLEEFLDRDTRKLSGGQRQRVLLAIALVNDPQLLFLDEPTTGLDPQARRNFWALVADIKAAGKTVVLTTHYMEEAYRLCDEIAIMDHGRIIAQGSPQALLAEHFDDSVIELPLTALNPRVTVAYQQRDDVAEITTADVGATLSQLQSAGVGLSQLRVRERTLEDLFLELTGKELRA